MSTRANNTYTVKRLKQKAKDRGMKGYSKLRKQELLDLVFPTSLQTRRGTTLSSPVSKFSLLSLIIDFIICRTTSKLHQCCKLCTDTFPSLSIMNLVKGVGLARGGV